MTHPQDFTFHKSLAVRLVQIACAAVLISAVGPLRAAQLIAPDVPVGGLNQRFLQAQFMQWLLSYPEATNPYLDPTGAFTQEGDQGSYFFLTGSPSEDPVFRNVTVRPDQTLMLDLQIAVAWMDADFTTEAAIRQDASDTLGEVSNLTVTVDGVSALLPVGYSSLNEFRMTSPLFPLNFIEGNITGMPPGVIPAVTDGFVIALEGLSAGNHVVNFTSFIHSTVYDFTMAQDITYYVSSVPEASTWAMMSLGLFSIVGIGMRRRRG